MKSLRFRRASIAFGLVALGIIADVSTASAIGGCSRRPNPTNPDDAGYVNCLAGDYRGCRSQCRALNHCYNANNPPGLTGCAQLLREFNDCVSNNGSASMTGSTVSWGENGCQMSGDVFSLAIGGKVSQGLNADAYDAVPIEDCDWVVTSVLSSYFGIPGSQIHSTTDIRDDLGASQAEVNDVTTLVGDHFGVFVEAEVAENMRTVSDIVGCIQQAAQ